MYEYVNATGLGIWGVVGPAAGIAATGYALYRAHRADQQAEAQSQARGVIEGPIAAQCRTSIGAPCSTQQISDICNNLSYGQLTDQHWSECRPHVTADHLCQLSEGIRCSRADVADFCAVRTAATQPIDCPIYIEQVASERRYAELQRSGVVNDLGVKGLGWTRVEGSTTCDEIQEGHPICFRDTVVDGNPPEQEFARNQGCLPLQSGARCETSPYGNPGIQWCCPPGWPREPDAGPLQPGEFPPAPPGVMNKIQFWKQYWWFWALAVGVPIAGYLGYQHLKDEGYIAGSPGLEDIYGYENIEIGA